MDIWSIRWSVAALAEVLNSNEVKSEKISRQERFTRDEIMERQLAKAQRSAESQTKEGKAA